ERPARLFDGESVAYFLCVIPPAGCLVHRCQGDNFRHSRYNHERCLTNPTRSHMAPAKATPSRPWWEAQMPRLLSAVEMAALISIALVAALEAAIEVQRGLPETEVMVPMTGWLRLAPLGLLILAACLWLCRLLLPNRRTIEILAPLEDESVPHMREVRGSVWP